MNYENDRVDILLIKYQHPQIECDAIASLLYNTDWPYILTIYDNRGGTKNMAWVWNRFVANSKTKFQIIVDSDVVFTKNWLTQMMDTMLYHKDAGIVVPATNQCNEGIQVYKDRTKAPDITLESDTGLVSGFCFLMRKAILKDTGGFDERFGFYGQDSEFFVRVHLLTKWKVFVEPRSYVIHHAGYSTNNYEESYDFKADKKQALRLFQELTRKHAKKVGAQPLW